MDATLFDRLTRALIAAPSRRRVLLGLAGAALGFVPAGHSSVTGAKKRKKPKPNEYGCLDVGKTCRGKDNVCCSGICQGKKPKKGKKDKSRCVAHNVRDCVLGVDTCSEGVEVFCGNGNICYPTTGKAVFCAEGFVECEPSCTKDVDCEASRGPGAACIACDFACGPTFCVAAGTN